MITDGVSWEPGCEHDPRCMCWACKIVKDSKAKKARELDELKRGVGDVEYQVDKVRVYRCPPIKQKGDDGKWYKVRDSNSGMILIRSKDFFAYVDSYVDVKVVLPVKPLTMSDVKEKRGRPKKEYEPVPAAVAAKMEVAFLAEKAAQAAQEQGSGVEKAGEAH